METDAKDVNPKRTRQDANGGSSITYTLRPDATPEGELAALAAAYAFVLQVHERNEVAASYDEDEEGR